MATQEDNAETNEILRLSDFEDWLNPILSFNSLKNASIIYFELSPYYNDRRYELQLTTTDKYDESSYEWHVNVSQPFNNDPFVWHSDCIKEEAQKQVVDLLKQYLESGQHAGTLKNHDSVVIGNFGQAECIYKKPD